MRLTSLLSQVQIFLASLRRLVTGRTGSSPACSVDAASSSDVKEERLGTTVAGTRRVRVSCRLDVDTLKNRCTCILFAYVSENR